jgi:hypothetical protein
MQHLLNRRSLMLLAIATPVGLMIGTAAGQDSHSSGGGHTPGGQGRGGGGSGGGHVPGGGEDTEHSHDDSEHSDTTHEHTEHDPDSGHAGGEAGGRRGPRYRGGSTTIGPTQRGHGRSLEDRVLKDN